MEHENLFKKPLTIFDELDRIEKEHPIESSEESHPQVEQLIVKAKDVIKARRMKRQIHRSKN